MNSACTALQDELQAVSQATNDIMILAKIDQQPEAVIDYLAWQFHVDFYDIDFDLPLKRQLVKNSIAWHRRKGTKSVVQEMVSSVFTGGTVHEWFEYGGDPYRFRVEVTKLSDDEMLYNRLIMLINAVKNTRSWLDGIIQETGMTLEPLVGIAQHYTSHITIKAGAI